ncbi:carbohydrate kinase [Telmatocola sphagniphila]|uniref:Carbohydrate kinase n=1 Tax=Telmatocola sphagniphila TaxID=1123043 RepID=A0A8E6EYV8_9BACT|nr:PfkB family carbohydrate kinase [Telmatocola sphagniphila]QVL32756.1 carbohydrate kinase [Telmatocola sphagniphila]
MLDSAKIEAILSQLPKVKIGLIGDLFLDRYLDIDSRLTEPSIETGLDAYQVANVRSYPGAMGTVINNLVALGVGKIVPISFVGVDGEGFELQESLRKMQVVDLKAVLLTSDRRTPTYCKPMLGEPGQPSRELNRLDTKNRTPTSREIEDKIVENLRNLFSEFDALIALDQVSEENCGVLTTRVREALIQIAGEQSEKFVLSDSRERINLFRKTWIKPNQREYELLLSEFRAEGYSAESLQDKMGTEFQGAFCTAGEAGIKIYRKQAAAETAHAYPVNGQIDIVGAGDSCSAAIASAIACGQSPLTAAQFGNLIASITIQQIGVTGTASPEQIRERWRQVVGN